MSPKSAEYVTYNSFYEDFYRFACAKIHLHHLSFTGEILGLRFLSLEDKREQTTNESEFHS